MQVLDPYVFGVLSALAGMFLFGITNVAYLRLSKDINIMDIMFTRFWVSLPLAYVFAVGSLGTVNIIIPTDAMVPLGVSMVTGLVVGDAMYFISQERIGISRAFPIAMSYPLIVYMITATFLGEPVIFQRVVGAVLTVAGVIVIARVGPTQNQYKNERWNEQDKRIGFVLALLSALAWASSDAIFQFGMISVGAAESNYFRMLVVSIILVPIFFGSLRGERKFPTKRITGLALVTGFIGVGVSMIAYSYAIKFAGATVTSVIGAAAPIFTAPLSAIYLGEDVNRKIVLGTLLTILGVFLVVVIF
jgi:drug/metabolite transporter (DMT)-like permease